MPRLGAEQRVHGDVVGTRGQRLERHALHAERGEALVVHVRIVGDDLRLERRHAPRERAADVAEAHDADRLAVQRARAIAGHAAAPHAGVHLLVQRDDLAVPRQQQRQRVIRHFAHPDVRDVDDDHAELGRRRYVDDVVADAGADNDLETFERAHHAAGHRRERGDDRVGVTGAGDDLVLLVHRGQGGQAGGDTVERGLAVGVVARSLSLDDVDVIGPVGHDASVVSDEKSWAREVYCTVLEGTNDSPSGLATVPALA
jgi:hypothetical protein